MKIERHLLLLAVALCGSADSAEPDTIELRGTQTRLVRDVRIPARESGVLEELRVKVGDQVRPGTVLGVIDSEVEEAGLRVAEIQRQLAEIRSANDVDLRYARKSQSVAQSALSRSEEAASLVEQSVSRSELELLALELDRSKLAVEQAQRDMKTAAMTLKLRSEEHILAGIRLRRRSVTAPVAGLVVETTTEPGEWIQAGTPLVRIIQLDRLYAEAFADRHIIHRIRKGTKARFVRNGQSRNSAFEGEADNDEFISGVVVFVSPEVKAVSQTVLVRVELDNRQHLIMPGDVGTLTLELTAKHEPVVSQQNSEPLR